VPKRRTRLHKLHYQQLQIDPTTRRWRLALTLTHTKPTHGNSKARFDMCKRPQHHMQQDIRIMNSVRLTALLCAIVLEVRAARAALVQLEDAAAIT
jgi:hypothetical protein